MRFYTFYYFFDDFLWFYTASELTSLFYNNIFGFGVEASPLPPAYATDSCTVWEIMYDQMCEIWIRLFHIICISLQYLRFRRESRKFYLFDKIFALQYISMHACVCMKAKDR